MKCLLTIFLFVIIVFSCFSQSNERNEKKKRKVQFHLEFDTRNSFFAGSSVKLGGLKVGVEIIKSHRVGLGFYSLRSPVILSSINENNDKLSLNFNYTVLYYDYIFFRNDKWEFDASVQYGGGKLTASLLNSNNKQIEDVNGKPIQSVFPFSMLGFSIDGHYKFWSWIGVGTGTGYQIAVSKNTDVSKALTAPFYVLKLKLFPGVIFKNFKKKKVDKSSS